MSRRWVMLGWTAALAVLTGAISGCVDRRFVIETDPLPGANVQINGKLVGATPVDQQFLYYGKYRFVYFRDGFQPLVVDEEISTPWWSYFPLDFVVENLLPFTVRDVRYIRHTLPPIQTIPPDDILSRGEVLREKAGSLGVPLGAGFVK